MGCGYGQASTPARSWAGLVICIVVLNSTEWEARNLAVADTILDRLAAGATAGGLEDRQTNTEAGRRR